MGALHGLLLVDKAQGWTSHDVVAKVRGLTRQRKIGHTGTLDPMATGLLVLCLGDATRLVEYMAVHEKWYQAEVRLGVRTDTDDAEGSATERRAVPTLDDLTLQALERQFTGELLQRPPAYSAVKIAGQRAYAAARAGRNVVLAERPVTVHSLRLEVVGPGQLGIAVHCGSGFYVRSLARDIGEYLGCGGHLAGLRRTAAGRFSVSDALNLSAVAEVCADGRLDDLLLAPDEGIAETRAAILSVVHGQTFRHGGIVRCEAATPGMTGRMRAYDAEGAFLGVAAAAAGGELRPLKVLATVPH